MKLEKEDRLLLDEINRKLGSLLDTTISVPVGLQFNRKGAIRFSKLIERLLEEDK